MDNESNSSSVKTSSSNNNQNQNKEDLSEFNKALKKALDFNDKNDNKKGSKMNDGNKSVKIVGGGAI